MDCRHDGRLLEQALELCLGVVGDTDGPGFAGFEDIFHRFVGLCIDQSSHSIEKAVSGTTHMDVV